MKSKSMVRPATLAAFSTSFLACAALCGEAEEDSRWVHPLCRPLAVESNGPFVELADGTLMTIDIQGMRVSKDDGKLSYPYCLERRPGEIWVIAGFAFKRGWQEPLPLRLKIDEEELLSEARKDP